MRDHIFPLLNEQIYFSKALFLQGKNNFKKINEMIVIFKKEVSESVQKISQFICLEIAFFPSKSLYLNFFLQFNHHVYVTIKISTTKSFIQQAIFLQSELFSK